MTSFHTKTHALALHLAVRLEVAAAFEGLGDDEWVAEFGTWVDNRQRSRETGIHANGVFYPDHKWHGHPPYRDGRVETRITTYLSMYEGLTEWDTLLNGWDADHDGLPAIYGLAHHWDWQSSSCIGVWGNDDHRPDAPTVRASQPRNPRTVPETLAAVRTAVATASLLFHRRDTVNIKGRRPGEWNDPPVDENTVVHGIAEPEESYGLALVGVVRGEHGLPTPAGMDVPAVTRGLLQVARTMAVRDADRPTEPHPDHPDRTYMNRPVGPRASLMCDPATPAGAADLLNALTVIGNAAPSDRAVHAAAWLDTGDADNLLSYAALAGATR